MNEIYKKRYIKSERIRYWSIFSELFIESDNPEMRFVINPYFCGTHQRCMEFSLSQENSNKFSTGDSPIYFDTVEKETYETISYMSTHLHISTPNGAYYNNQLFDSTITTSKYFIELTKMNLFDGAFVVNVYESN